jgi:DNA-binding IclR family transcriptional regulator
MSSKKPSKQPAVRQRASDDPDPFFATTLARGLEILGAFQPGDEGLSNAELSGRTGLSRPTISRLTNTLLQLGYLNRNDAGRYLLGTQILRVAYPLLAQLRIRQVARPIMREFAEQAKGTVSIGTIDGLDALYIETTRLFSVPDFVPDIGFNLPLVRSAMGRTLLAMLPPERRSEVVARIKREAPDAWKQFGKTTEKSIEQCQKRGFCASLGDFRPQIHAVAAPLATLRDGALLAINCGIEVYRLRPGELEGEYGPRLVALAASIRAQDNTTIREAA